MATALLADGYTMPKRDKTTPRADEERISTSTTRLPSELLRMAKVIAAYRDMELGEYLQGLLNQPVRRDYDEIVKK